MSVQNCGLKPLWDQVVIEIAKQEESKIGNIFIPRTDNEAKPVKGTIVAIGPGKKEEDMSALTAGNTVLFRQYSGTEFEQDSKKYVVVRAADILCEVID